MSGVDLPPVSDPPHTSGMGYDDARGVWEIGCVGGDFSVRGGPNAPDPFRLDLAWRVAARIDAVLAEAKAYLAGQVAPGRHGVTAGWDLMGAEFGVEASDSEDTFDVLLNIDGDWLTGWCVAFRPSGARSHHYTPVRFSRRQW